MTKNGVNSIFRNQSILDKAFKKIMKNWQNLSKNESGLDKGFRFVKLKTVNPTAFLRFGGRRQFLFL